VHVNIFPRSISSTDTSRPEKQVYKCISTMWSATAPITSIAAPNSSSHNRRRRPRSPPLPDPKVGCCLLTPARGSKLSKFSQPTNHAKRFKTTSNPNTFIAKLSVYTHNQGHDIKIGYAGYIIIIMRINKALAFYKAMPNKYSNSDGREHLCASSNRSFRSCSRSSGLTPQLWDSLDSQK
jgi:hypothetical protein